MEYKLSTFKTKIFLIWMYPALFSLLIASTFLSVQLGLTGSHFGLLCLISFLISYFIALNQSKSTTLIVLDKNYIQIEQENLNWVDIQGFYINREGIGMTEIEIRNNNHKVYSITSLNYGTIGKDFHNFLSEFKNIAKIENPIIKELTYFDIRPKQQNNYRIFILISIFILLILNLIYVYLIWFTDYPANWKIFLINLSLIGLYNFYKRNKK